VLLVLHRQAEKRAFWAGFAIVGWGYVGLTLMPSIEPRLLTTKALVYLDSKAPGRAVTITGQAWEGTGTISSPPGYVAFTPQGNLTAGNTNFVPIRLWSKNTGSLLGSGSGTTENFLRIGHCLCALILAWLGGKLSRCLHMRSRDVPPEPGHP
jgi:hypothetical protein